MSLAACDERCARLRTSDAPPAKPRPLRRRARLDCGVERQEVGLAGDLVDDTDMSEILREDPRSSPSPRPLWRLPDRPGRRPRGWRRPMIGLLGVFGVLAARSPTTPPSRPRFPQARGLLLGALRQVGVAVDIAAEALVTSRSRDFLFGTTALIVPIRPLTPPHNARFRPTCLRAEYAW